jgi:hypothetical protein
MMPLARPKEGLLSAPQARDLVPADTSRPPLVYGRPGIAVQSLFGSDAIDLVQATGSHGTAS